MTPSDNYEITSAVRFIAIGRGLVLQKFSNPCDETQKQIST